MTRYQQVQAGFSTIYLTMTSVVVALVLEKLVDRVHQLGALPPENADQLLVWVMAAVVLTVAFNVWVIIAYFVLALRWDLGLYDAATPFILLILISAAIYSIGHGDGQVFFLIAALGQASGTIMTTQIRRETQRNAPSAAFLAQMNFRPIHLVGILSILTPLVTGVLLGLDLIGSQGAVIGACLLLATLLALIHMFAAAWWTALAKVDDAQAREARGRS